MTIGYVNFSIENYNLNSFYDFSVQYRIGLFVSHNLACVVLCIQFFFYLFDFLLVL
jgi:hypothetical protein